MHQPPVRLATPPVRTHLLAGQRRNHSGGDRQSPQRHGPRTSSVRPETAGVGGQPNNQTPWTSPGWHAASHPIPARSRASGARGRAAPPATPESSEWCRRSGSQTVMYPLFRWAAEERKSSRIRYIPGRAGATASQPLRARQRIRRRTHLGVPVIQPNRAFGFSRQRTVSSSGVGRGVGYPATMADRIPFCLERGHAGVGVQTAECVTRLPVPRIGPYEGHGRRRRRHWYLRQWRLARGRAIRSRQP